MFALAAWFDRIEEPIDQLIAPHFCASPKLGPWCPPPFNVCRGLFFFLWGGVEMRSVRFVDVSRITNHHFFKLLFHGSCFRSFHVSEWNSCMFLLKNLQCRNVVKECLKIYGSNFKVIYNSTVQLSLNVLCSTSFVLYD